MLTCATLVRFPDVLDRIGTKFNNQAENVTLFNAELQLMVQQFITAIYYLLLHNDSDQAWHYLHYKMRGSRPSGLESRIRFHWAICLSTSNANLLGNHCGEEF